MLYIILIFIILVLLYLLYKKGNSCQFVLPVSRYRTNPDENLKLLSNTDIDKNNDIIDDLDHNIDIFCSRDKHILCWIDQTTHLMWEIKNQKNFDNLYTFDEATKYINELNKISYGGYHNWRLPTIDELITIANIPVFDYRIEGKVFAERSIWLKHNAKKRVGARFIKKPFAIILNSQVISWYWSSSEYNRDATGSVWVIDFFEGGTYHNCKKDRNLVVAVRNSKH